MIYTFDDIGRSRTKRLGRDWVALFNGKYSRQQAVFLVGRLGLYYFIDCGHGHMLRALELEGRGRLWGMFGGFEMLIEIRVVRYYGSLIFAIEEANLNGH